MRRLLAIFIVCCAPAVALAWPSFAPEPPQPPHPAVVRIVAMEDHGMSMGSGSLVATNEKHGLVITNWHVVRDATGPIQVVFADGFMSPAWILKADRLWDLAALGILKPRVAPLPLSKEVPRPGQRLTIAGYGPKGAYRAVAGRCTDYFSPDGRSPREWVEVSVCARQGDSGGPIFNDRGELAGVLFGSNSESTMGSYCGRVRNFLMTVDRDFERAPAGGEMLAQRPPPPTYTAATATAAVMANAQPAPPSQAQAEPPQAEPPSSNPLRPPVARSPVVVAATNQPPTAMAPPSPGVSMFSLPPRERPSVAVAPPLRPAPPIVAVALPTPQSMQPSPASVPTRGDQIKTILAVIGVVLLLFHAMRLAGTAVG